MTTYDSTIPTAMSQLLTLFNTVATANSPFGPAGQQSGIQVVDGVPIEYVANYMIVLKGFSNWKQNWWTTGQAFDRLEEYDLDCQIHCWQGDTDPNGRRTEAFTILAAIRSQLYTQLQSGNGILGLPMSADAAIDSGDALQGPANGTSGWGIDLDFIIHVENATLT